MCKCANPPLTYLFRALRLSCSLLCNRFGESFIIISDFLFLEQGGPSAFLLSGAPANERFDPNLGESGGKQR